MWTMPSLYQEERNILITIGGEFRQKEFHANRPSLNNSHFPLVLYNLLSHNLLLFFNLTYRFLSSAPFLHLYFFTRTSMSFKIYITSEKTILWKDTCTPTFIAALPTIAWKQPKCPSTEEWIKKMWGVCVCVCVYIYIYIYRNIMQP